MIKDGGPAFPTPIAGVGLAVYESKTVGLSLRDYFAGLAMQALIPLLSHVDITEIADESYAMADAMISEREKNV